MVERELQRKVCRVSPILPPKEDEELVPRTAYLPARMWERLSEIADETKAAGPKKGYSRNEVIIHFLNWALVEYEREKTMERKPKK